MPREREAWKAWAVQMLAHRMRVHDACRDDLDERKLQKALCRQPNGLGQIYFLVTFGWIYEPREDDDSAWAPFILFPAQAEFLLALDGAMQRPKGQYSSLAVPKARGVGATWLDMGDHLWRWLFKKNYQGRVVSRIEDLVDQPGNSDSMMWKLDFMVEKLPYWLVPDQYSTRSRYRTHMMMRNPSNGNAISGEATQSGIGVGGRATKYTIDEAARLRDLDLVWGQLSETTNHRVAISTHNIEYSTHFWDMVQGENGWDPPLILPMAWHANLLRDEAWLEATRRTMRHDLFEREILMNPWAGISGWTHPEAKKKQLAPHILRRDGGSVLHGLDDGWDDDFACVWVQRQGDRYVVLDGYQNSHKPVRYYGHLLKGELPGKFDWDSEAYRIAHWVQDHRTWHGLYYGDRHGDNTDITSGTSAWQVLRDEFGIYVMTNPPTRNTLKDRRDALAEWLQDLEFADTPGAADVLHALKNNRFPTARSGSQPTAEYRKPIHDWTSHYVTALEYSAVHIIDERPVPLSRTGVTTATRNTFLQPTHSLYGRRRPPQRESQHQWIA
jgi:hypothetical protein